MKKIIITLAILLVITGWINMTFAQNVYIPDVNFKAVLVSDSNINTNHDGEIQFSEANSFLGTLYVYNSNISDLTGIEAFTNISVLNCAGNNLSSLDLTYNTALVNLSCNNNQLTSIDVLHCAALTSIVCNNNLLTSLDVSGCTALMLLNCSYNQITALDLSANTALTDLSVHFNQLSNLNVSSHTAITNLSCNNNLLTSLDISGCSALTALECGINQLTNLDVSTNTDLIQLYCYQNQITSLDVSNNPHLTELVAYVNYLTALDISANTSVNNLWCYSNHLTSLNVKNGNNYNFTFFRAANNPNLTCIQVDDAAWANTNWANYKDPGASFTEYPALTAGVSISVNPPTTVCPGTNVMFTATPINGGVSPTFQWQVNGNNVGSNSSVYSDSTLENYDQVRCIMYSSEACLTANPVYDSVILSIYDSTAVNPGTYGPVCINASPFELNGNPPAGIFYGPGVADSMFYPLLAQSGSHNIWYVYNDGNCTYTVSTNIIVNNPPVVSAGQDITMACTDSIAMLNGFSSDSLVNYYWVADDTSAIILNENTQTPTVYSPGKYILTVFNDITDCYASDTVEVFSDTCDIQPYYPPPPNGKNDSLIGPELTQLYLYPQNMDSVENVFMLAGDSVYIEVIIILGQENSARAILQSLGMTDTIQHGDSTLIVSGKFPRGNLPLLNQYPELFVYARPMFPAIVSSGIAYTLGDSFQHSDIGRSAFGLDGQGVKVGVLSDSYRTLPGRPDSTDVLNGDLPGFGNPDSNLVPVQILKDYPYGRRTDEGRAMLQIIHDIAPKSTLVFRTGFLTPENFALGIRELQAAGCNIICDDITYITEPFFTDGAVAEAVNDVTALGVTYFTAAGNFNSNSYEATFSPAPAPSGITGFAHDFGSGDIFQSVTLAPGNYTIVLQWEDDFYSLSKSANGAANDFDIYLTDDAGRVLLGYNRINIGNDPYEVLPVSVKSTTSANIMIVRANPAGANARLKYIVYRGNLTQNEYLTGTSTVVGQANSAGAITVGAANFSYMDPVTHQCSDTPVYTASFSSRGGTVMNSVDRHKPDFVAPNGFKTTVNLGGLKCAGDISTFYNFYGTSAAAPHAAAVGALLQQAEKKFYNQSFTPEQIRSILQSTAVDMDAPGYDVNSGYGLVDAYAALSSFAAPTPKLISLDVPLGITPGTVSFTLTVTGQFFTSNSVIYFRDIALTTTFIDDTHLSAVIPDFAGNPPIKVFNPAITPDSLDGGFSNILYFFTPVRKNVVIKADNKTKKFGEALPLFTATVTVDDHSLEDEGLTLDDLDLDTIHYTLPAGISSMSDVGQYFIDPGAGPFSIELTELYNYIFITHSNYYEYNYTSPGLLTINKMPLLITPDNKTVLFGDKIDGTEFTYTYSYDTSNIAQGDQAGFLNDLKNIYEPSIAKEVVLIDDRDLYNGTTLSGTDLANLAFISGSRGIVNGSRGIANGSRGIANGTTPDTTYVVDITYQSLFEYNLNDSAANLYDSVLMINGSRGIVNGSRGIVNSESLVDGSALINGSRGIANGSRGIANGSRGIVNSEELDGVSNTNTAVIIHETDLDTPENPDSVFQLLSICAISGLTSGEHWIVPGGFLSANFEVHYGLGHLFIDPYEIKVQVKDTSTQYGTDPSFTSVISGYQYDDNASTVFTGNIIYTPPSNTLFTVGTHTITPGGLTLIQPTNYYLNFVSGTLNVTPFTEYCTYGQGFWGNAGNIDCFGNTASTIIPALLTSALVNGCGTRKITIGTTEATCLINKLPAGGPSEKLPVGDVSCANATGNQYLKNGRFRNNLLGQEMALALSVRLQPALGSLRITGQFITTYAASACVNGLPVQGTKHTYELKKSVINYLGPNNTVADLIKLANQGLGDALPANAPSLNDIGSTINALLNAFSNCKILDGFSNKKSLTAEMDEATGSFDNRLFINPNPTSVNTTISFSAVDGSNATIDIYSISGSHVSKVLCGAISEDGIYSVEVDCSAFSKGFYVVHLVVDGETSVGKLVIIK